MKYLRIYLFLLIAVPLFFSCNNAQHKRPEIKNGFLDLSSWNFEKDGSVNLNGEWEFYWEKLLDPRDFRNHNSLPEYIKVPNSWTKKNSEGKSYPEFGYATYRLIIKVQDNLADFKLILSSIYSSSKLWVNGTNCFESGVVATSKEESKPIHFKNFVIENQPNNTKNDTIEIIIQVADFYKGGPYAGLIRKITFGSTDQINKAEKQEYSLRSALMGILLLISLYHFFLYAYRKNDFSYLLFSLLSLVAASRTFFTSGIFVNFLSYDGCFRYGFTPVIIYPPLLISFFYFLYKKEVHKNILYASLIIALMFIPFIFTFSANMINKLEPLSAVFSLSVVIYLLGYSLPLAVIRKRQGAIIAFIGLAILFVSNIHDALFSQGLLIGFGIYITEVGFGIYIVLQSLILAESFSLSLKNNIILNNELEYQNLNLEAIVISRTKVIEEQKLSLEDQNLDLNHQKVEIQKQNEALNQKNKEITDSLNYAKRIQTAMLPPEMYFGELLHENFIYYKPKDIVSGDFYWIKQVNHYIILVAADCTGHGVPGAFMSMLGLSYLNEIVQRREVTQANQILNELRSEIKHSLRQHGQSDESKDGMDIALCVINMKNKMMQFAGAYNPLIILRDENGAPELIEMKGDRMPVGFYHGLDKSFTNNEIQLKIGDTLYIFSDGFMDQIGGNEDKKYMSKNFKKLLLEIYEQPLYSQKEILDKTFKEWMRGHSQTDDVLVIGVRM
jgi:serine phosphatase RsbU (regulator of sigma subunit)